MVSICLVESRTSPLSSRSETARGNGTMTVFWRSAQSEDDRPLWFGAATFDRSVGLSHTTGEVTHHIGPDVDAERDRIAKQLVSRNWVQEEYWENRFHKQLEGRNGGGDPWHTDGKLVLLELEDPHADSLQNNKEEP